MTEIWRRLGMTSGGLTFGHGGGLARGGHQGGTATAPGGASERVRTVTLLALGALAVLNGADVVTTHLLLVHRAVEANPLSAILLANQSLLWVKLALLAVLGLKVMRSRPRLGVMGAACFAAGIYATAVLSNLLVLHLTGAI